MVLSRSYSATLRIADAGLAAPSALRSGDGVTSTPITHCEHRRQFAETGSVGRSGFRFARRPIRFVACYVDTLKTDIKTDIYVIN